MHAVIQVLLELAGIALLVVGAALAWAPAGFIVGGVGLLSIARGLARADSTP